METLNLEENLLKKFYHKIVDLGVNPNDSPDEVRRISLLNRICLLVIILIQIYCLYYLLTGLYKPFFISQTLSLGWYLIFFLTYKRKHYAARWIALGLANFTILLLVYLYSTQSGVFFYFIPTAISAFCLFPLNQKKELLISLLLPITLFIFSEYFSDLLPNIETINSPIALEILYNATFILSLLTTLLFVYFFARQNQIFERELIKAKEDAEKAAKAKSNFLSMMSHEIRTPISAILGFSDLLNDTPLNETQLTHLKNLKVSGKNLLNIINEILDFSLLENGKIIAVNSPFNLADLIDEIGNNLKPFADNKKLHLIIEKEGNYHQDFLGDSKIINQILVNLTQNAIKFTSDGSVRIVYSAGQIQPDGIQQVTLRVIDTGIGFNDTDIQTIFERFSQVSSDINRKYGGTGLGLAIVKELVKIINGKLEVRSSLGKGSEFILTLELPITKEKVVKKEVEEVYDYSIISGLQILLAEDDDFNALIAKQIIEGWGADLQVAVNGLEAIHACKEKEYDIILMDVQMPECDGITATHRIRNDQSGLNRSTPIIGFTANLGKEEREKGFESGMTDYMLKPYKREELYRTLKHARHPLV